VNNQAPNIKWRRRELEFQVAENVIFRRLLKNAQMQGPRNPEAQELTKEAYLKWYAATSLPRA
jgi:hypothetical protein